MRKSGENQNKKWHKEVIKNMYICFIKPEKKGALYLKNYFLMTISWIFTSFSPPDHTGHITFDFGSTIWETSFMMIFLFS